MRARETLSAFNRISGQPMHAGFDFGSLLSRRKSAQGKGMIENENTALVRRWFEELWNQRRLETIDELLAPDAVANDLAGPNATVRGRAAFRAAAETLMGAFGEIHFTVEDIFGVEDRVAVRLTLRLEHTGQLGDLPPTGKKVTVPVMCMIEVRDGKIMGGWNNWDVATALRAANAPPGQTTLWQ